MAGYSRQSVADIIANAVIKAAPVNAEYNAIRDAFAFSGGHKHDGSSTEGAYVPLIADVDANNKVVIDSTNNRISFYVEVSGSPEEQLRIQNGAVVPVTDDDIDLGASGAEFKDLYIDGIGYIDSVVITGGTIDDTVIGGTTPAAGDFTNVGLTGNLSVTGTSTLTGTATITSADINSGSMDNTVIGNTTPVAGTFTTLNTTGLATLASADVNGGNIDGTIIGASTPAAATVTDLTASGTSTLTTVDINGGAIDGTVIGASSAAAGSFTTVSTSGQATLATVDVNGGAIDGTTIGATTPAAITGTTVTATSFVGPVTGNVTGNLTGNVTGNLTGDVTGNVTASSGSSTFNDVTINGTLNMDAATTATITNLSTPVASGDAASKGYVDTQVANLVDSAPGTLDTLNELAAALGDDPNFSTTITTSIATKLPLAGGTMTGDIAMGTNKITGLGDPTAAQDAATQNYVTTNFLDLSGGTMTGAIDMGSSKVTTTYAPVNGPDLTNKTYVDTILGSSTDAATSAAAAATSATNAATSETNAANSATAAASSATDAAASYDSFDDRYLGAKASPPATDNDGDALITGALFFDTTANLMKVYDGSSWVDAGSAVNGTAERQVYTATASQTVFSSTYDVGFVDVYLNGIKLVSGTDYTATNGTSITLAAGATAGDTVDIVAYGAFNIANTYTQAQADARYLIGTNNLSDLDSASTARTNLGVGTGDSPSFAGLTVDTNTLYVDSANNRVGVGTSSPDTALTVSVADDTIGARFKGANGIFRVLPFETGLGVKIAALNGNETGFETLAYQADDHQFVTGITERMRIDSSGNVGIGTTSPSSLLDVDKSQNSETNIELTNTNTGADAQVRTKYTTDGGLFTVGKTSNAHAYSGDAYVHNVDNTNIRFATSDTERFRIGSSGQLGIGGANYGTSGQVLTSNGSSAAPSWQTVAFTTNVITGNTTATANNHYYLNGSAITLTLPASPSVGDEVRISEVAGNTDCIIGRNGSNIMSAADDLTIDSAYAVIYLRYVDATIGWAFS
jgi:hypothetical protein